MFSSITAHEFDTESYSMSPTCFDLFLPSSGRYLTKKKKNATVANYDFFLSDFSLMMIEKCQNM